MSEAAKTPEIKLPLLAKAHYNNVAERPDELSFRQGDTITVLDIDHNGQVDWWLCELRGVVGMVPANYLDVFHSSGPGYDTYDVPRSTAVSPHSVHSTHTDDGRDIYDLPPAEASVVPDPPDYDMPPTEGPDYDRPPSRAVLLPSRHDCEEEPERSGSRHSLHAVDIEASVYGPEAYWGTDNKARRMDTLQRTVTAAKYFDRALVALLGFGKGVVQHPRNLLRRQLQEEFTVLVQANKALLFKGTQKVLTSCDNQARGDFIDDYASIPTEDNTEQSNGKSEVPQLPSPDDPNSESNKRNGTLPMTYHLCLLQLYPPPTKGIKPTPKAAAQLPSQQQQQQQIGGDTTTTTSSCFSRSEKSSLGSSSGSSDENISNNVTTVNKIESPYGRPVANSKHTNSTSQPLRQEDRELLERFSQQMELIIPNLRETVDITVLCLDDNEPPKDFVNKSNSLWLQPTN
eukprot:Em0018g837a